MTVCLHAWLWLLMLLWSIAIPSCPLGGGCDGEEKVIRGEFWEAIKEWVVCLEVLQLWTYVEKLDTLLECLMWACVSVPWCTGAEKQGPLPAYISMFLQMLGAAWGDMRFIVPHLVTSRSFRRSIQVLPLHAKGLLQMLEVPLHDLL